MTTFNQWLLRWLNGASLLMVVLVMVVAGGAFAGWWPWPRHGLVVGVAGFMLWMLALLWVRWLRERQVREAPLPQFLKRKLREIYPHLSGKEADLVERGLRQFFLSCLRSNKQFVAMPSRVVDAMWHEFILHTKAYQAWCRYSLGWFLHHTPAEALGKKAQNNDGLRRTWFWACKDEGINPHAPTRLPLLFALDAKLHIANGFVYSADCGVLTRKNAQDDDNTGGSYCGTSFSDSSYPGSAANFGGADTSGATGGGDGAGDNGCSGDGCGGGD